MTVAQNNTMSLRDVTFGAATVTALVPRQKCFISEAAEVFLSNLSINLMLVCSPSASPFCLHSGSHLIYLGFLMSLGGTCKLILIAVLVLTAAVWVGGTEQPVDIPFRQRSASTLGQTASSKRFSDTTAAAKVSP